MKQLVAVLIAVLMAIALVAAVPAIAQDKEESSALVVEGGQQQEARRAAVPQGTVLPIPLGGGLFDAYPYDPLYGEAPENNKGAVILAQNVRITSFSVSIAGGGASWGPRLAQVGAELWLNDIKIVTLSLWSFPGSARVWSEVVFSPPRQGRQGDELSVHSVQLGCTETECVGPGMNAAAQVTLR